MMAETRKILGDDSTRDLRHLRARAGLQRPLRVGQRRRPREDLSPERCREVLAARSRAWSVVDDPGAGRYPMPIDAAGRDDVFVGRIRRDPSHERCLNLWVVSDNLRKGAATNAVQLAELVLERGLVGPRALGCARRPTGRAAPARSRRQPVSASSRSVKVRHRRSRPSSTHASQVAGCPSTSTPLTGRGRASARTRSRGRRGRRTPSGQHSKYSQWSCMSTIHCRTPSAPHVHAPLERRHDRDELVVGVDRGRSCRRRPCG